MKIIERFSSETDGRHGCEPAGRPMQDYVSLSIAPMDKPRGPSSHEVSSWVKRVVGAKKTGHAGTLDPNVSGVLPVAIDSATKAMQFLLRSDKEYAGIMRFHKRMDEDGVRKLFARQVGTIQQLPPVRSAVRRVLRERRIHSLQLLEMRNSDALFRVSCEAGTYIRKLCFDIGKQAGCGANMQELRRVKAAGIGEERLCTLQALSDAVWLWKEKGEEGELRKMLLPVESALQAKKIWIVDGAVDAVCSGAQLALPGVAKFEAGIEAGGRVALMTLKGELVALATSEMPESQLAEGQRGFAAKTLRVVMPAGTYPRTWKTHEKVQKYE